MMDRIAQLDIAAPRQAAARAAPSPARAGQRKNPVRSTAEYRADETMALLNELVRRSPGAGGQGLAGRVLGLVGFGQVGQAVARRAATGLGMEVLVFDTVAPHPDTLAATGARAMGSLAELLPLCDVVSLHCTASEQSRNMIDGACFDRMKEDALLINTAAPEIVDELVLTQALMFDLIGGAALGHFDHAPRSDAMLSQCDRFVTTSDLAGATRMAVQRAGLRVV